MILWKTRCYCKLKEAALDRTLWRTDFRRGCGPLIIIDICMSKGYYIIVWRCAPYRPIVTSELVPTAFRADLGTRYVTICVWCLACCRKEWGEALYDDARGARIVGRGVRETVNRKRKLSAVFLQPILHTCHTYCYYAYHFYAYWLYFIYVWHVYVSPKTYKWSGNFIIKDGKYTFTFYYYYYYIYLTAIG
jgi:hypothetical protein